ncbi:PH domain-containing protein [Curtobacterium sp. Leaf261]|uniref:PH domain-containing protein n=1 Tax=Curtobacterium sp. Leaf261 TaxID=1736311 RepID=UPI0006F3F6B0|nr:hypothetical protein [Curtobacterium sp. Leaf261]KQO62878.1 hypothetical protein ASF23_08115 [Curtobacterium sp. Leaf261]
MPDDHSAPLIPAAASGSPAPFRIVAPGLRTFAVVLWIVAALLVPIGIVGSGPRALVFVWAPSLFTAAVAWFVLWRPRIEATAEALVVVDVRRTSTIAWRRVEAVSAKYGLEVTTSEGVRRIWIAPRPTARLRIDPEQGTSVTRVATSTEDDRTGGPVPVTVAAAARRLVAFVPVDESGDALPPAQVTAAPITHRAHWVAILLLIVLGTLGSLSGAQL